MYRLSKATWTGPAGPFAGLLAPICAALLLLAGASRARAQCQGTLSSTDVAADCTARNNTPALKADIDPKKPYSLEELIDVAESNNPLTRIAWESAKQAAERLGIARSEYYPHLAALALAGDERAIDTVAQTAWGSERILSARRIHPGGGRRFEVQRLRFRKARRESGSQ